MRDTLLHLLVLAFSITPAATANGQATFERLGVAPQTTHPASRGYDISSNGRFIVGIAATARDQIRAFRWSREEGLVLLARAGDRHIESASGVSNDGAVVVGIALSTNTLWGMPIAWVHGKPTILPTVPPAPYPDGSAGDVTSDGRTIVGGVLPTPSSRVGVRWRDGKVEDLSGLPGEGAPYGIGSIAEDEHPATLAAAVEDVGQRSVRIHRDRVYQLGDIPGAPRGMEQTAYGISDDGRRIVGRSSSATVVYGEAYLWSEPTGMVGLGTIPSAIRLSTSHAISGDGRVVVGHTGTDRLYSYLGFIWDPVRGMRHLNAVLDAYGIDREGWSIVGVNSVSRDGTAMTGDALDATGTRGEAFLVTLPPWCWADCTGDGVVDFSDLLCFLNRFERAQDPRANPIDFFYCDLAADDEIDFNDFLAFLNLYNKGCGE